MGLKVREAEKQKVPYMIDIGDKEMADRSVALRKHGGANLGVMGVGAVVARLLEEVGQ